MNCYECINFDRANAPPQYTKDCGVCKITNLVRYGLFEYCALPEKHRNGKIKGLS